MQVERGELDPCPLAVKLSEEADWRLARGFRDRPPPLPLPRKPLKLTS